MQHVRCAAGFAGCLALLLPAASEARPWLDPERRPAVQERTGSFLAWAGEFFACVWDETGMILNPDGRP